MYINLQNKPAIKKKLYWTGYVAAVLLQDLRM
jgi:hypothetical protein